MTTAIVADLTTGTGRFNMTTGMVGLVAAIAASVGTTAFGFVAQELGPRVTFFGHALDRQVRRFSSSGLCLGEGMPLGNTGKEEFAQLD